MVMTSRTTDLLIISRGSKEILNANKSWIVTEPDFYDFGIRYPMNFELSSNKKSP